MWKGKDIQQLFKVFKPWDSQSRTVDLGAGDLFEVAAALCTVGYKSASLGSSYWMPAPALWPVVILKCVPWETEEPLAKNH